MSERIRPRHLERRAILYVRQSTPEQVHHNTESQRLQYAMEARLRQLGWRQIEVIDDDLGRSAAGCIERPGFERMLAQICMGEVGAVAARELSRFARNNRQWAQLVEICSLVDTLLVDEDNVYDSRHGNDRLLLGVKGTLSEYELDLLRHRAQEGRRSKASRGELYTGLPAGYVLGEDGGLHKDPDRRVQHAIGMVFNKFLEIGSARQVLLWLLENGVQLPVAQRGSRSLSLCWRDPTYALVVRTLNNPIYAGTYRYGRRKVTKRVESDGRIIKAQRLQPNGKSDVLIIDHHEGYVSRDVFERIQQTLDGNTATRGSGGAPKKGAALLSGLLRCRRCGRKLTTSYTGTPRQPRYVCDQGRKNLGHFSCLGFGGRAVDDAVAAEILRVVMPAALDAAAQAAKDASTEHAHVIDALRLELEGARYETERARRQYDRVEPENRLVAMELERRWNASLQRASEVERRLQEATAHREVVPPPELRSLQALSQDLPRIWRAPETDLRLKKRIARTLIEEVLVDVNAEAAMIELVIHWKGGVHTELRVHRRRRGEHGNATSTDALTAIETLARVCDDERIAMFLNRNGVLTGTGKPWSRERVSSTRKSRGIPSRDSPQRKDGGWMKLVEAAAYVGIAATTLRKHIDEGLVEALHPLRDGPWIVTREALDRPEVRAHLTRPPKAATGSSNGTIPMFPET